jgi:hypothetical protein
MNEKPYYIVTKDLSGTYKGIVTMSSFESKDAFDNWRKNGIDGYLVMAEGISEDKALEICAQNNTLEIMLEVAKREASEAPAGTQQQVLDGRLLELEFISKDPFLIAKRYSGNNN